MEREILLREHGEAGGNLALGNGKAKHVPSFELSKFVSILSLKNTLSVFFRELLIIWGVELTGVYAESFTWTFF